MEKVTIEAFDKNGVKLGERDEEKPTTMAELLDQFEEKDIVTLVWRSHAIDVQRELRAAARGPVTKTPAELAFAKLPQSEKDRIMGITK